MYASALFLLCGLIFVNQVCAQRTEDDRVASKSERFNSNSIKQSQKRSDSTSTKINNTPVPSTETLQNSATEAFQSLSNIHIESAADVDKLISEIENAADDIYNSEMANIKSWSQDEILSPFQSQAEEGLTIARDRLKESAQTLRTKATEAIENAHASMSPEEFSRYMKELQQVIEIELAPTRQYFMDAAEAISQVAKETAAQASRKSSRGSKSQKKNSKAQNIPQSTNIPISTQA